MSQKGHKEQQGQQQQRKGSKSGPPKQNPYKGTFQVHKPGQYKPENITDSDLRNTMDFYGRNKQELMTVKELRMCHNVLGMNPKERELRETLHILTRERDDGRVDPEDFMILMRSKLGPDEFSKEELQAAFDQYDKDGSGDISPDELREILSGSGLTEEQLDDLIENADTDGDGTISFDEFFILFTDMMK